MVFKRKFNGRPKRVFKRRRYSVGGRRTSLPVKNRAAIRKINSRVETKHILHRINNEIVPGIGMTPVCVNTVGQGTAEGQRIGESVNGTTLDLNVALLLEATTLLASDAWNLIRFALVVDIQPKTSGVPPTYGEIWDLSGVSLMSDVLTARFWPLRRRFHVMWSKVTTVSALATTIANSDWVAGGSPVRVFSKHFRLRKKIVYSPSSVNVQRNAIWFMAFSTSSLTPHPTVFLCSSFKYTDC